MSTYYTTIESTESATENITELTTLVESSSSPYFSIVEENTSLISTIIMSNLSTNTYDEDTTIYNSDNSTINSTEITPEDYVQFPNDMLAFTAACAFIIAILGTIGNLLTIIALPMCKKLRTTSTAFVVNLAVVELLFCVIVLPMAGTQYIFLQYNGYSLLTHDDCIIYTLGRYTFTQVQLQTIVAIAFTRAIAVGYPRLYMKMNNNYFICIWIVCIWLYSLTIKIPTALGIFGSYRFNKKSMECDMANNKENKLPKAVALLVEAIIPLCIILILYIYIFVKVKVSSARVRRSSVKNNSIVTTDLHSMEGQSASPNTDRKNSFKSLKKLSARLSRRSSSITHCINNNRRDMRVARTIFIIFIIMIICSFPVAYVHVIDSDGQQPRRFLAVHILYWLQYCLNVVVYVLLNRQYRDAYVDLLVKLIPNFQKHKGYTFPWENTSTIGSKACSVRKPTTSSHNHNVSNGDTKRQSPANGVYEARLDVIPEVSSSAIVSSHSVDDAFVKEKIDDDVNDNRVFNSSPAIDKPIQFKILSEDGTNEEKQLWINKNGQHVSEPSSDVEDKI